MSEIEPYPEIDPSLYSGPPSDIEPIIDEINFLFAKYDCWFYGKEGNDFHNNLQFAVKDLAKRFGLFGICEYPIQNRGDGRNGYIDVAWVDKKLKPILLLELDRRFRNKSIYKLHSSKAPIKIWLLFAGKPVSFQEGYKKYYDRFSDFPKDIILIERERVWV